MAPGQLIISTTGGALAAKGSVYSKQPVGRLNLAAGSPGQGLTRRAAWPSSALVDRAARRDRGSAAARHPDRVRCAAGGDAASCAVTSRRTSRPRRCNAACCPPFRGYPTSSSPPAIRPAGRPGKKVGGELVSTPLRCPGGDVGFAIGGRESATIWKAAAAMCRRWARRRYGAYAYEGRRTRRTCFPPAGTCWSRRSSSPIW